VPVSEPTISKFGEFTLFYCRQQSTLITTLAATSLSRGTEGFSPIAIAEQGDEVILTFLCALGKFDVELKDRFDRTRYRTPLSWAA
jgi:hypothetical protein